MNISKWFFRLVHFFRYSSETSDIERVRRADLNIIFSINIFILGNLMFLARFSIEGESASRSIFLLPAGTLFIFLSLFLIKFFNLATLQTYLMLTFGTFIVFTRSHLTGGIVSAVTLWFVAIPILACLLLSLRHAVVWCGITLLSVTLLFKPEMIGLVKVQKSQDEIVHYLVIAIMLILTSCFVLFNEKERRSNEAKIKASEKKLADSHKLIALGSVSGSFAHEVNNPLAIINGHLDLLRMLSEKRQVNKSELDYSLNEMSENVKRIQGIVNSLRTFSTDDFFNHASLINLQKELPLYVKSKELELAISHVDMNLELPEEPVMIRGQLELVVRALDILLDNSLTEIKNQSYPWIKISVTKSQDRVLLSFTDSGTGITKDVATHMMEPFFTTKAADKAPGLGLNICQNLMRLHSGSIQYMEEAHNTTFLLSFPRHAPPSRAN